MRETSKTDSPERQMALRALVPGAVLAIAAFGVGYVANGLTAAVCAFLGVLLVSVSFAVYVVVLGKARKISGGALMGTVLGGWLVRLGVIVAALLAVRAVGGDVAAFGFAAIVTAIAVACYEAWFVLTGRLQFEPETGPTAEAGDAHPAEPERLGSGA